ncbi:hypothetical protein E2C01_049418 [Portunus trituberculatus]|uniref:Uncharacterized protein n=1 Tax=Portunus trituberculatus TaxID=210409 RepID=A0A5B7G5H2_PORTR|nr:hypothetical protein [Portunus trituberculatus]
MTFKTQAPHSPTAHLPTPNPPSFSLPHETALNFLSSPLHPIAPHLPSQQHPRGNTAQHFTFCLT